MECRNLALNFVSVRVDGLVYFITQCENVNEYCIGKGS